MVDPVLSDFCTHLFCIGLDPHQQESSSAKCWNLSKDPFAIYICNFQIANLNLVNMASWKFSSCFLNLFKVERLKQSFATRNQTSNQQFFPLSTILECKMFVDNRLWKWLPMVPQIFRHIPRCTNDLTLTISTKPSPKRTCVISIQIDV